MLIPKQAVSMTPMNRDYRSALLLPETVAEQDSIAEIRRLERQRIARDLHDELGQLLSTMRLNLHHIKTADTAASPTEKQLNIMHDLINRAQQATKTVVNNLRNSETAGLSMAEQIAAHVKAYVLETDIDCVLTLNETAALNALSSEKQITLFRVLQEALTNIVKHAVATKVVVSIDKVDQQLVLTVKDNGRGFGHAKLKQQSQSFGLIGMRERVAMLGGTLTAKNRFLGGVKISAKIPCMNLS